ncbi:MAG: alpha/beta hydrolase [Verrucomicrobiae bacterium]|nr:alpha/beta hydrolase [Verrucomicrobiae bacterium]
MHLPRLCKALVGLSLLASTLSLSAQRQQNLPSDEQILKRVPDGVTFIPNIAYREGNEAWKLDLAMPKVLGRKPRPGIVFIHGGGWRNGDKRAAGFLNPTLEYAGKGYVCVTVNYRMLTGDSFAIDECVEDVKNVVRWMRANAKKYNVDPERIGASGNSAGAHLSVMLGVCPTDAGLEGDGPYQEYSSKVQAVAASATPTSFLISMNRRLDMANRSEEEVAFRKKISPMTYVSAEVPPILLFHELSDGTVNVKQSDLFIQALREAGAKDVNYLLLGDGSGHGVFQKNIATTEPLREAFFERILKPGE